MHTPPCNIGITQGEGGGVERKVRSFTCRSWFLLSLWLAALITPLLQPHSAILAFDFGLLNPVTHRNLLPTISSRHLYAIFLAFALKTQQQIQQKIKTRTINNNYQGLGDTHKTNSLKNQSFSHFTSVFQTIFILKNLNKNNCHDFSKYSCSLRRHPESLRNCVDRT